MIKFLRRCLQIKQTPNPLCLKFIPEQPVMTEGTCDFPSATYASQSPLATEIFKIEGVKRIFYSTEYISITKGEMADWDSMQPQIETLITQYFSKNLPVFLSEVSKKSEYNKDSEVEGIIEEIIEGRIRPHVQEDGGDIRFIEFNESTGIVMLEMQGSCAGCPSAFATLKDGIEKMLMFYIPEVKGVISIN